MYIDRDEMETYPFTGYFYRGQIDENKPLDERKEEFVLVMETPCDITESSHGKQSDFIISSFAVYFPFDKENEQMAIKKGDMFQSDMYGMSVNGKVTGVFPSQLGGGLAYIQETTV